MTPQFIMRASLCREPHCARGDWRREARAIVENLNYAAEYAEPGYEDPRKGILFANWNYFPSELEGILERYGFAIEWDDEWSTCDGCDKAVRTSPDSYGWQPSSLVTEGAILCRDCLFAEDIETLENQPRRALNVYGLNPAAYGYTKLEGDFESGWYPGQNDNPETIFTRLSPTHPRLLFVIDTTGQFDIGFSIWEKLPEAEDC